MISIMNKFRYRLIFLYRYRLWFVICLCYILKSIYSPALVYAEGGACGIDPMNSVRQFIHAEEEKPDALKLYASSALLMDAATGRVLYDQNGKERKANASTTKIMTCILAIEYGNMDDIVTFSANASRQPDVQMNAGEGEQYYLKDLLYALMLESHNDVAVAVAEHIAGSVEEFAVYMNEKAEELGAYDTHFVTPNGLDAEGHYTTAYDLAVIARYAIQNAAFLEIIRTPAHTFSEVNGRRKASVVNRDAFLTQYEGAVGIKTGFTGNAGYCFVGAAKRDGKTLISVVLASGWPPHKTYKWADTKALMDYGFQWYSMRTILTDSLELPEVEVKQGIEADTIPVRLAAGTEITILVREDEEIRYEWELPEMIYAPAADGDVAGILNIYIDQSLYKSEVLYYAEDISVITYKYVVSCIFKQYFMVDSSMKNR